MKGKNLLFIVAFASFLAAPACSGTKLINPWRDPTFHGRVNRLFVVCMVRDRGPRGLLENEFIRKLKDQDTDAVASNAIFSENSLPEGEELRAKVRELGFDAMIGVKFVKKETGDTYTPARNYTVPQNIIMSWDDLYGAPSDNSQDVSYDYKVAIMQTTLFSAGSGKPIWSSLSETRYEGSLVKQFKSFVGVIVRVLHKEEFIR